MDEYTKRLERRVNTLESELEELRAHVGVLRAHLREATDAIRHFAPVSIFNLTPLEPHMGRKETPRAHTSEPPAESFGSTHSSEPPVDKPQTDNTAVMDHTTQQPTWPSEDIGVAPIHPDETARIHEQVIEPVALQAMVKAVLGAHAAEILEMLNEDDYWMIRAMASVIEDGNQERDVRVRVLDALFIIGQQHEIVFTILMNRGALTKWIYTDMQNEEDLELMRLALCFLSKICSTHKTLPPSVSSKLGYNLVEYLIELTQRFYNFPPSGDPDDSHMRDITLSVLLNINIHAPNNDVTENKVLNKLMAMTEANSDMGQLFITVLNRAENEELLPPLVKLLSDIFANPVTSKGFFFKNDLRVLVEVLVRTITDLVDGPLRRLYLGALEQFLINSEYRDTLHRADDVVALLNTLSVYPDDPELAAKARAILETCPFLHSN
eukprot:TRINITY_DN2328_c0_g1_i1.p1 TRINITY_DN2328_c0_g1~~TRINITY_DN2328_c0_g1_i1.p1  ORF type:complete len:438 (-),score=69.67 TRINITY_DN2328_c0_g1_i1:931-2244(-)